MSDARRPTPDARRPTPDAPRSTPDGSKREAGSRSFRAKRSPYAVIPREAKRESRHSARSEAQSRNPPRPQSRHSARSEARKPTFRARRSPYAVIQREAKPIRRHSARSEAQSRNPHRPQSSHFSRSQNARTQRRRDAKTGRTWVTSFVSPLPSINLRPPGASICRRSSVGVLLRGLPLDLRESAKSAVQSICLLHTFPEKDRAETAGDTD
jgi:hypothetical protein